MGKQVKNTSSNGLTPFEMGLIKFRQENPVFFKNHIEGLADSAGMTNIDYKSMGYGKAAAGRKDSWWLPGDQSRDSWAKWNIPENIALKAFEQQSVGELVGDVIVGGIKRFGAGFLDSIGAWDVSNMTAMAMDKTNVDYSNWFNRLGKKLTDNANEENQIYQDPSGSIWNGAYFANQVQQLGYTGGIIAEMVAENILLNSVTGGTSAAATTAKGARLFANIGKDALFGMAQGVKEAHMNALETQNNVFQKFKQLGFSDGEALAKSRKAANIHFKTETTALAGINALQNVMFLGSLSRGAKNITKNAFNREGDKLSLGISDAFQNAGEKVIGAITPNKTVQKLTGWGLLAGSESIEEGVQTGIGVYASNKVQGKDTTLDDLMTHEMRDSMIGGALGGVLMGAGFKAIANYTNRDFNKNYKNFLEDSINFSHNTLRAEDEARKNYNQIVKEYEANPSESNAKKLLNFKDELEKAKHNSSVATTFMSLNFDYAKGTGSTVAFDMHVAHMENVLEAVNTGNTEQLKNYGLLDEDTGKERFAGSLETIKNTYQDNIDNALQVKKFFSETLGEDTNDFKVASDIVLAKFNRFQTQKRNNKIDEELNTAYSADEVFKSLSSNSQKRFKLENELTGINKYVSDQDNPLVQQRKQEIKEELDNLPDYSTEEKAFISFDTSRDTGYATAYGNKMNLLLGINSATKEIAELSNPDNIKNRVKTSVEEALNKATTKEEIDSAIQEAKYHGVHTNKMDEVAKAKLKSIKASEAATKAAGVTTTPKAQPVEPVTKPVEEKVEKPNPNMQKAVSILGGKKFETSGIESTVAETLDNAITANTESLAQDAFSDPNTAQELKDTFSDIYDELQDELGRIPTHDDLVRKFIKAYGKEEVKGYLPGLERASELLGKAITDTSYLFQSLEKGRDLLKNLISNNTPEKENPVNSKHIDDTPNKEIETVERGTGFGANKAAIYNDYNRETGNYRQAEYLPGLPEDNTLRYFLKPGDKLIMALAENYESIHVAIMDRRVPTNVGHSGRTMPFGEFMEWVTTDEATKYGYRKLEKNSPEWKTLWNNKVPMVYHLYNEQTGEPDLRVAALVHDVEWWHRNNVSQISEKDPITIAREGAESTAEERRRFFEEGKRVAEVTEVSQLGTEFYLVKQEADGSWVSNVDTGEMYITLEEATGATRLGVATASNKIRLEDGTELTIGEKHPNTEQPILLNTKSFSEGTIVEVRKIKDINGNPVYKAYTPIIDKAAKGQQLNDTTFNIVKYIILSRIYNKIQSEDIKNYLKTNYNVDVNSVQALENALKESRLGSLEGNIDEVVSNFIMTSNSINYSQKGNWTQLVLGKDFMKVYYKGKLQSINFNNTAEKSVSNIKEIENFLELLLGADNDGVLRNTTVDVKKEKLISKGQMFVVDSVGNVQPFQSLHGQNTYAGYLKSIVKTSVKSFPAKELGPNGETQWITDVQPMVYISNANVVGSVTDINDEIETPEVDINEVTVGGITYDKEGLELLREIDPEAYELLVNNSTHYFGESEARNEFETQPGELGNLNIPGITAKELNDVGAFLFNSVLGTIEQNDSNTIKPRLIYDRLMSSPEQFLFEKMQNYRRIAENLRANPKFNEAMEPIASRYETNANKLQSIIDNKKVITDVLKLQLDELLGQEFIIDSITEGYINQEGDYVNDVFNEDFEYGEQIETNYSKMSTEKDIRLTYSTALKIAFAGIQVKNHRGDKVSGEFDLPIFEDINSVSETVKALIVGLPSNTNMMLEKLKEVSITAGNKQTANIASEMYNKIKNAPEHVKNEMLYKLAQQKLNMEMVIYSTDNKGRYTLKVQNTNSNADLFRIRDQWRVNFLKSSFVEANKDNEKVLNKEYLKNFYDRVKDLHTNIDARLLENEKQVQDETFQIFQDLGITIGRNTFDNIWNAGTIIKDKSGFFGILLRQIEPITKKEEELSLDKEDNRFLDSGLNSKLKVLAGVELVLNSTLATPSQRVAGKSYPGTSQRIMLDDITDQLFNTRSSLFTFLKGAAYSKRNFLLDIIENTDFLNNIENYYTRVSPIAIKEQGKKDFGDNSIDKIADSDNILATLGFFQHSSKEKLNTTGTNFSYPSIAFRIGKMFSPALSDKGQMVAITTALLDLKKNNFNIEGNKVSLSDDVLDFMLVNLFDSEFDRIVYSYNNPTNIKGYEQANKFFNAIPAFNDIEVGESTLYEVLRETINNPDIEDKQAAFENIRSSVRYNAKEILNRIIEADLNTKIKNNEEGLVTGGTWVKAGILSNSEATENKPSEVALKYIDSKYVSSKEDADLNNLQKGKIAALDFIVNHYLFQSNIYQLYVGDMALYAPGAKKYLAKDGTLDSFNLSNETGQAITKRIASLIAPGNVLANSTLDNGMPAKYIQIFVNDVQAPSSIVEEYIKMVNDGKIPEDQKEHLENYKSEDSVVKNTAIDALKNMNPTIAEYFDIEGTDAQEYTTWQEHLDVLYGQGRITKEDKERFANNIKNDSLTDEDLKIILNPLKPVYAGMLQDTQNGVNRFVYVKSSSFPLLPQLTKGLKLDKVRIAMEKLQEEGQNVRMSYQTANKVGAVNTTLHMSDFYNTTPETLNDLIENKIKPNTLILNRSSFKVQQDTPYKAKKYMEKNKDTQTTLGSQMFKNLMGAGINQMGAVFPNLFPQTILNELGINIPRGAMLTGPQLDSIKTLVETKYMELQSKNLENEIGIVPGQSYFTLPVEKKQQIFKNLIDVLKNEIKTRQYDKALLKELEIDETGLETTIPIWITNNADKFESLFLSIVKNRFISIKLPGNGHIVGSSEGFERIDTLDNLSGDVKSNIVWVDPNHTGDLKATYITTKDGKKVVSESEILVQSHYIVNVKDKTGKIVSKKINLLDDEYSTVNDKGERVLKLDKIDPELLSNFSFRIPTSAHQSGAILKVVGFLPENSGDLLIVPDEHTKQIGEDFDIDKRYVYKSNYKINKETGRIEKISLDNIEELKNLIEEFKLSQDNQDTDRLVEALLDINIGDLAQEIQNEIENLVGKSVLEITTKSNNLKNSILNKLTLAGLENAMIDTYKSVYQSPSEEVQKKIFRILSMDVAEKTANLIDSTINVVDKQNYTFLSDEVQRKQMKSGTSGKLGTAMHSNAVTLQAQMERLKDKLTITFKNEDGETQNKEIRIGDLISDGVLGITETLDGGREVNAVHAENQNSAVDNVKANIMAKRNENSYTMPVLIQLTFRRFDQVPVTRVVDGKTITTKEHLPSLFLAQPILRRYVELMEESKSITSEFSYNTEANIIEKLYKEFSTPGIDINDNVNYMSASEKMTGTELYNNLSGEPNNFVQAGVLRKFLELKAEAEELQDIQRVMSLSSGGLGKSYFDVIDRIERLNALPYSSIKNASKLIGIHTVYDAKLDLEDPEHYKGYIVLGDKAWKPTTSEGAMLLHSLKTAEQIMDINYPYNRNFISRTLNNIIAEKGTPLNANNTTEFKWKVLKSLKDFLQSDSDLNYFVGDIDAERKRLFGNEVTTGFVKTNYKVRVQENTHVKAINPKTGRLEDGIGTLIIVDNSKGERILHRAILGNKPVFNKFNQFVQNKNFVIKKEEDGSYTYHNYTQKVVKESLADYLHRIKQERDGRGNLIHPIFASNNLLKSLDIQLNDKYSNNISIIKHANVDAIDFNMLGKNEYFLQMLDDNTTNIGTWNGEQMTPRKLAQDLASYAYLSNQENGAIGFRQFIDTNYLKAIGYDKQLKQVLDKYDSSERIQNTFLKQYYQHNPEQARIISVNNITLDNIVRLDPETNKYRNTNQSPETKLNNILRNVKEFTLVDNDSNEIKTKFIAIRDTSIKYSDNQYRLFEYTGEGTGYVEIPVLGTFGYNEYNQNNYNQTSSLTNKEFSPISIFSGTVAGPDGLWDTFENNIETEDLNDFYNFDSVEVFANTVKQLALNSGVKETIELLEDYLDPRTKIEVINFNDVGRTGQGVYIHETNTILINSESIRQGLNSGLELSEVLERLNSIFTEELLHSVQVNALKQYGTTRIVDHGTHKENVFTPNSDAPVFVTKLVALYNEAKSVLPYVHGQENYESKDIFEFMAGAFDHRSEYRQKLDTIKDFKGKSLMDRFKEIVGQAIQFLTGNYSSEVKQTVIDLMNNTQDLRGRNIAKPVTTTIIKVEGTSSRPDISFVDKKDVQAELDSGGLVSDITELMKNIKDKSLITPENLLSLLQENNIIKKEC